MWALGSVAYPNCRELTLAHTGRRERTCYRANVGETGCVGERKGEVGEVGEKDEDNRVRRQKQGPFAVGGPGREQYKWRGNGDERSNTRCGMASKLTGWDTKRHRAR